MLHILDMVALLWLGGSNALRLDVQRKLACFFSSPLTHGVWRFYSSGKDGAPRNESWIFDERSQTF